MTVEPLFIDVTMLDAQDDRRCVQGRWDIREFAYGDEVLSLCDDPAYDLVLANTGEGILLTGTLEARAQGPCARCLAPVTFEVGADVEGYFVFEDAPAPDDMANDEFADVDDEGRVDVAPALMGALLFGTPYVILCSDDCPGLCPTCGARLADGPCSCADDAGDDSPDPDGPFAALADLDLG